MSIYKDGKPKGLYNSDMRRTAVGVDLPIPIGNIKKELDKLTDDERLELFSNYCRHCGSNDPSCQCWNDD